MRIYRNELPASVAIDTSAEAVTAVLVDAMGVEHGEPIAAKVAGGKATVEVEPPHLGQWMLEFSTGAAVPLDLRAAPYFTVEEFRAYDNGAKLSDAVTDDDIRAVRSHVEDIFETAAGVPFTLRGACERLRGRGMSVISVDNVPPHRVTSCTVGGCRIDAVPWKWSLSFPRVIRNDEFVDVCYEYGYAVPPDALSHNAIVFANSIIGGAGVNPRAIGAQSEFGWMNFSVAGKDGATGIPEVDAFLSSDAAKGGHGIKRLVVA